MTVRLAPRGHKTFDVYDGTRLVGSVWHYHEGWAAFDRRHLMVAGFFATEQQAAQALARSTDPTEVMP